MLTKKELSELKVVELYEIAKENEVPSYYKMRKLELIFEILKAQSRSNKVDKGISKADGFLEVLPDGYGFLRPFFYNRGRDDIYIAHSQIRRFNLKTGDRVEGTLRAPKDNERYFALLKVERVNGLDPEVVAKRIHFDALTPIYPDEKFNLSDVISDRMIDLIAPIGKGQRGLIVAPPKTGKTTIIRDIANGIMENNENIEMIILLIDERPEEVTDIERNVKCEVVASTFDESPDNHVKLAEMVLEKAKRLVECKKDVVILLDSITRLARAYNIIAPSSGRVLSGGLDPYSLYKPKRFLGAARNIEEGGSLTIIASALVDTGSRMDDVIFEEFKGTGNMELVLDRYLANTRHFPAININLSGTREDKRLFSEEEKNFNRDLRRHVEKKTTLGAQKILLEAIKNTKSNRELIAGSQILLKG